MTPQRLEEILDAAHDRRLLVIGDLMLDEFVWGKVGRISPEAPVPVVEVTGESFYPGGAANVARNLREFTESVSVMGAVGQDASGRRLHDLLAGQNIELLNPVASPDFSTIVKTRIIARQQQVVRVDRETISALGSADVKRAAEAVRKKLPAIDAVIFEDYGKGFLSAALVAQIARDAKAAGKIVSADPNPRNPIDWSGMTVIKPNRSEAFIAAGMTVTDWDDSPTTDVNLRRAGDAVIQKWNAQYVLITLGEQGMMLFESGKEPHHIPTKARQVFDVSGAGDTAIALFTLALCAGATALEAADIANHGSAVVVAKLGTATVNRGELIASFRNES
ncbi:MAG: bifunctional heptose 7-phosphate kinase/heptose 1-phosphate adenyltransferase [Chthoniobacterales bacterium]